MFETVFEPINVYIESDFDFKCEPIRAINTTSGDLTLSWFVFFSVYLLQIRSNRLILRDLEKAIRI